MTKQQGKCWKEDFFDNDKQLCKAGESGRSIRAESEACEQNSWRNDVDAARERTGTDCDRSVRHGIRSDRRIRRGI